jgi:hypothetical protein
MESCLIPFQHSCFGTDPIGIVFDNENADEYDSETGTILPRLRSCESASDVLHVVHEEFVRWFDAGNAGLVERYADIASEVWRLWQSHRQSAPDEQPDGRRTIPIALKIRGPAF